MSYEADRKDFWEFMGGRGTLLLAPVVVLNPDKATEFFLSNTGKPWDYNIFTNNCKHYVMQGLLKGLALFPRSELINPLPYHWSTPYLMYWNSSMTQPKLLFTK